jgi:hypothetical protein
VQLFLHKKLSNPYRSDKTKGRGNSCLADLCPTPAFPVCGTMVKGPLDRFLPHAEASHGQLLCLRCSGRMAVQIFIESLPVSEK